MPRLTFVAAAYQYYPVLLPSLLMQRHQDWECVLVHDGPSDDYQRWVDGFADQRIRLYCTAERRGFWGHPNRGYGISLASPESALLCVTNADNYYCPNFCDAMSAAVVGDYAAAYCDMVHSHYDWALMRTRPFNSQIDCGAWVAKTDVARAVGWRWTGYAADWDFIEACLTAIGGRERAAYVDKPLFVHN